MPSYDLACLDCGLRFEVFRQRFLRDEDRACPGCGGSRSEQRLGGFIASRPARDDPTPRVVGFRGHSCGHRHG